MSKINKILIGTNNKGKFAEIADLLPKNLEKISPKDLKIESPEETGKTFIENSELKANFFCKKSKIITISDDSGLEVDCLQGEPGIFSARWAKDYGSFYNASLEILKRVEKSNKNNKTKNYNANFICALTIQWPDGKKYSDIGKIDGKITGIKGKNGFGYDPIFIPNGYSQTFAEMKYQKKLEIDHRKVAFDKLNKKIKDYF